MEEIADVRSLTAAGLPGSAAEAVANARSQVNEVREARDRVRASREAIMLLQPTLDDVEAMEVEVRDADIALEGADEAYNAACDEVKLAAAQRDSDGQQ